MAAAGSADDDHRSGSQRTGGLRALSITSNVLVARQLVAVVVMIVIAMVVAPRPVFLLFVGWQLAEIAMPVAVSFAGPLAIVNDLVVAPNVIVRVIRIVNAIGMMLTGDPG